MRKVKNSSQDIIRDATLAGSTDTIAIDTSLHNKNRSARAFRSKKEARTYWIILITLILLGIVASYGLLVYNNPVEVTSPNFIPVVRRRLNAIIAMLVAAFCQSLATVAFQSSTNNRIITPSLLGFEAIYSTIHTSTIFFFGTTVFVRFNRGFGAFIFQVVVMVLLCLVLYGWLLAGKYGNLQLMLLIGVIIGTGLRSVSAFMRRLLAPSEFDVLQARLFASVNNANAEYYPIAIPIVLVAGILIILYAKKLNIISLGSAVSMALGVKPKAGTIYVLVLVSILMSISTALVGPLTFYGFLVATLAYQAAPTYDHRFVFPMSLAMGFIIITGAYFIMNHVLSRGLGAVSILIEMFGGIIFLIVLLRKGTL